MIKVYGMWEELESSLMDPEVLIGKLLQFI